MNTTDYRDRFGLSHHPFDKEFLRDNIFESDRLRQFQERFKWLLNDRGIGLLTGSSGVGKTACLHSIIKKLPPHRYRILYLEDSQAGANDIYRTLALHLGLVPSFRRSKFWCEIKQHILKLNDENDQQVILVIDDAHKLPGDFLHSLSAFMNFIFDSREILTIWLVGDSHLVRTLNQAQYGHLMSRVHLRIHMESMNKKEFSAYILACLSAAGCERQILGDVAMDAAFHLSKGIPRIIGKLLTTAMRIAHEDKKDIICERIIEQAKELVLA
ncbi:MAG: ExeA family protein [Methanosarcinaceae archaeon]